MVAPLRVLLLDGDPAHVSACEAALCNERPGAALIAARDASEALALAVASAPTSCWWTSPRRAGWRRCAGCAPRCPSAPWSR